MLITAALIRLAVVESVDLRAVWMPATLEGMSTISVDDASSSTLYEQLVYDHGSYAVAAGIAAAPASPSTSPSSRLLPPSLSMVPSPSSPLSRRSSGGGGGGGGAASASAADFTAGVVSPLPPQLGELAALSTVKTLRHLRLPMLSSAAFKTLVSGLASLVTLTVEGLVPSDGDATGIDFSKLGDLTNLEQLQIRGSRGGLTLSPFAFGGGINNLGFLDQLTVLEVTGLRAANAEEFGYLARLRRLRALCLGDCELWDEGVYQALSSLTSLTHLRLEVGGGEQSHLAAAIKNMSKLVRLDLMLYHLPAGLAKIVGSLQALETLCLQPFDFSSEDDVAEDRTVPANENALAAACAAAQVSEVRWGMLGRTSTHKCAFQTGARLMMESQDSLKAKLKRSLPNTVAVAVHLFDSVELSAANFMQAVHFHPAASGAAAATDVGGGGGAGRERGGARRERGTRPKFSNDNNSNARGRRTSAATVAAMMGVAGARGTRASASLSN